MIQIENLSKVFRTSEVETIALNHVSMEVKEGEFVAIMGPSEREGAYTTPQRSNRFCLSELQSDG